MILPDCVQMEQGRAQDVFHRADAVTACRLMNTSPEAGAPNHNSSPCTRGGWWQSALQKAKQPPEEAQGKGLLTATAISAF